MPWSVSSCFRSKLSHEAFNSNCLYGIGRRALPFLSTACYRKFWSGNGKPAAAHCSRILAGDVASSAPSAKLYSKCSSLRKLAARTCTGIEVSEDFDGDSRIADKGRDPLNNLLVLLLLFVPSEFSAGRDQTLYVRILGHESRVGRLAVDKPKKVPNAQSLVGISAIN